MEGQPSFVLNKSDLYVTKSTHKDPRVHLKGVSERKSSGPWPVQNFIKPPPTPSVFKSNVLKAPEGDKKRHAFGVNVVRRTLGGVRKDNPAGFIKTEFGGGEGVPVYTAKAAPSS